MANLILRNADIGTKNFPLDASRTYAIGRFSGDVTLEFEPACSPRHATLKFDGSVWRLVDEMSQEGTMVDGRPVNFAEMRAGVVARIGETELEVGTPTQAPQPTPIENAPVASVEPKADAAPASPAAKPKMAGAVQPGRPYAAAPKAKASVATSSASVDSKIRQEISVAPPSERSGQTLGAAIASRQPKKSDPSIKIVSACIALGVIALLAFVIVKNTGDNEQGSEKKSLPIVVESGKASNTESGKAAQAFFEAKSITDTQERLKALRAVEAAYADVMVDSTAKELAVVTRETHQIFLKEVKAQVVGFVIKADTAFPFDEATSLARFDVRTAYNEMAALQKRIGEFEAKNALVFSAIQELGYDRDATARIELYLTKSAEYLDNVRMEARRFELMTMYPQASEILLDAIGHLLLTPEVAEGLRLEAEALAIRKPPSLDDWIRELDAAKPTAPAGSVVKKDEPAIPTPEGGSTTKEDEPAEPEKPIEGGNPKEVKEQPAKPQPVPVKALPRVLTFFPNNAEEDARLAQALQKALILMVNREGYEPRSTRLDKRYYKLMAAGEEGVSFSVSKEEVHFTWATLPLPLFAETLKTYKIDQGPGGLALACVAAVAQDFELAGTLLAAQIKERPELKEEADIYFSSRAGKDVPEGGLVIYERRLMFPEEHANLLRLKSIEDELSNLKSALRSNSKTAPEKRAEAFAKLLTLGEEAILPALEVLKKSREEALEDATKTTGLGKKDVKELDALKSELIVRRKFALELIFDEGKWPYPYGPNNDEVTQEVMKRVRAVREIWENPAKVKGRASKKTDEIFDQLRQLNAWMDELDPSREHHESDAAADIEYLTAIANKALNIQNHAIDGNERGFITKAQTIMDENEVLTKEWAGKPEAPDALAWEQLRVTNDYRFMMGRMPLKMNFKLYWAAKHHSKWCMEKNGGQISHDSPGGARGENPSARAAFEGYSRGVGENIHMNGAGPTPQSSHDSWLSSSGHHRNILSENWVVMGNARDGVIWTQKFGSTDEGKENFVSKGGK